MKNLLGLISFLFVSSFLIAQNSQREFPMTEGDTTYIMKKYVICFLKEGENRDQDSLQAATIQTEHLKHLNRVC